MGFQTTGTASEYFAVDAGKVTPLPESWTYSEGAMIEPLAVTVHAVRRAGDVCGQKIAVLGAGPIGILLAQSAKALGAALVLVTLGPRGAYYRAAAGRGLLPACEVDTVDTTGAGDAFLGALLSCLAGKTLEELRILPQAQWERIVAFANAAGSLTTAAKGAIPAMPAREQILRLCGE